MKDIKKTDVEIWDQLRFDITTLQLFSVDEESFNVAYKLLERKYVQEIEVDKELMTILREFFRYFSDVFGPNSNDTGPKLLLTYYL